MKDLNALDVKAVSGAGEGPGGEGLSQVPGDGILVFHNNVMTNGECLACHAQGQFTIGFRGAEVSFPGGIAQHQQNEIERKLEELWKWTKEQLGIE